MTVFFSTRKVISKVGINYKPEHEGVRVFCCYYAFFVIFLSRLSIIFLGGSICRKEIGLFFQWLF